MNWYNWYYGITPESVEEATIQANEIIKTEGSFAKTEGSFAKTEGSFAKTEVEVNPHTFPSANFTQPEPMVNIAQLETEQESVEFLIYPSNKRTKRTR